MAQYLKLLSKLLKEKVGVWPRLLPYGLWADKTSQLQNSQNNGLVHIW